MLKLGNEMEEKTVKQLIVLLTNCRNDTLDEIQSCLSLVKLDFIKLENDLEKLINENKNLKEENNE